MSIEAVSELGIRGKCGEELRYQVLEAGLCPRHGYADAGRIDHCLSERQMEVLFR